MVPIENIYYLFCYAWDHASLAAPARRSTEPGAQLENLFAHLLCEGLAHQLKRGLSRSYIVEADELRSPRGRIDVQTTLRRQLDRLGRARCDFDELSVDVPANQVFKATLRRLLVLDRVDQSLKDRMHDQLRQLHGVRDVELGVRLFEDATSARGAAHQRFMLDVCRLLHESLLPKTSAGHRRFVDLTDDERTQGRIFEAFVRRFFGREQRSFDVKNEEHLSWHEEYDEKASRFLPLMRTDLSLVSHGRRVVVETKLYGSLFAKSRGVQPKLRSGHLYQLLAYLRSAAIHWPQLRVDGLLLYGTGGESIRADYRLREHVIHVRSIDLSVAWPEIRAQMSSLIQGLSESGGHVHQQGLRGP